MMVQDQLVKTMLPHNHCPTARQKWVSISMVDDKGLVMLLLKVKGLINTKFKIMGHKPSVIATMYTDRVSPPTSRPQPSMHGTSTVSTQ